MAYFREHPVLLAVCICLGVALWLTSEFQNRAQIVRMAQAINELTEAARKDEDVMKLSWCHLDSTTGKEMQVVAEVSQFPGETQPDLESRFEAHVTYLKNKYEPNCP